MCSRRSTRSARKASASCSSPTTCATRWRRATAQPWQDAGHRAAGPDHARGAAGHDGRRPGDGRARRLARRHGVKGGQTMKDHMFYERESGRLEAFAALTAQTLDPAQVPFAAEVEKNVPIYAMAAMGTFFS